MMHFFLFGLTVIIIPFIIIIICFVNTNEAKNLEG